jgi:hypothetical protein
MWEFIPIDPPFATHCDTFGSFAVKEKIPHAEQQRNQLLNGGSDFLW